MNPPSPPVTLDTLAKAANLSKGAISLALRGRPGVSEATRKRVRRLADQLGYRPDAAMASLNDRRWHPHQRKPTWNLAWLTEEANGLDILNAAAQAKGYGVSMIQLRPGMKARELNRELRALDLHGVLLNRISHPVLGRPSWWKEVAWKDFVWVAVNEGLLAPPVHRVLNNAFAATSGSLEKIQRLGYRRIVFIRNPDLESRVNVRQHAAFLQFACSHPRLASADFELGRSEPIPDRWFERVRDFEPDVLLLGYPGLHRRLPQELQQLPWASLGIWEPDGQVAGHYWDFTEITKLAIDMADLQIRRNAVGIPKRRHTMLVDGVWTNGTNLPDRRRAGR